MTQAIKKILIVGRDTDAWLTALMLQKSLTGSNSSIQLEFLELNSQMGLHDFYALLPNQKVLHKMSGINENSLLRISKAHYSYGQRFSNWSKSGAPFLHAYDRFGFDFDGVNFFQYWTKAHNQGMPVALEDFNLGAVAAKQGRYVIFDESNKTISNAQHGFHVSAATYTAAIAKIALSIGLTHTQGTISTIETEKDQIKSIKLVDGEELAADFYIDATGAEASLISAIETDNLDSWSQYFHCDRMITASAPALNPKPGFSQITAFSEGWMGIYPLLDRTGIHVLYSSKHANLETVLDKIVALSGLKMHSVVEAPFNTGTRKKHWIGNCVALGSSATCLEPLDATQLHALHLGLSLLHRLFPTNLETSLEAKIYNEKMNAHITQVRDFQLAHYYLNKRFGDAFWDKQRFGENFWDHTRSDLLPQSLKEKIELFESRGIVPLTDEETFYEENWTAIFNGHGLTPKNYDPLVDKMDDQVLMQKMQQLLSHIKEEIIKMPSLQTQIEMNLL